MLTDGRMWTDRVQDYVSAIEKSDAGDPVNGLEARRLADMLQDSAFGTHERDEFYDFLDDREEAADADDISLIEVTTDELDAHIPFMPDANSADDMVRKVTSFQRKSMGAYFGGDYEGADPTRVRVGTIHSAKGREADHVFVATDLTEKVVEQMAASIDDPTDVDGIEEFTKTTSPVPVLTDNERRVFYVGMSRARERLVIMESLISGAPTLPISVLLFNELRDEPAQELVDEVQAELAVPNPSRERRERRRRFARSSPAPHRSHPDRRGGRGRGRRRVRHGRRSVRRRPSVPHALFRAGPSVRAGDRSGRRRRGPRRLLCPVAVPRTGRT